jgi:histidine ammonia-lyase
LSVRVPPIVLDGSRLTLEALERVADGASCTLAPRARRTVRASRRVVERALASGAAVYGVNTGFGLLAHVRVPADRLAELQLNLVRSHAAGTGAPLDPRVVRAILALRANCLARGHSGVRLETVERLLDFLRTGVLPIVPEHGSVGASGDLAPLAHLALVLVGEGEALWRGRRVPGARALRAARLAPLVLEPKEGIALINGTQVMTAIGALALVEAERLAVVADVVGAMSVEALLGSHRPFEARVHDVRPQVGQRASATVARRVLRRSTIEASHRDCGRIQDAYSLRCMPQVHGAVRDALDYVRGVLAIEINATTDNPIVLEGTGELVSQGNFHGHPVSVALDHLATATASLATIAERRIERLLNPDLSGLPAFLAKDAGLHSGFMMAHVTAAALVSENKILSHPASVDTIPTSAAKEDHVSMGVHAARKAARVVDHVTTVLAIELLCATQALDLLRPLVGGVGVEAARASVRRLIPHLDRDRVLSPDIERARNLVRDGTLRRDVERAAGALA